MFTWLAEQFAREKAPRALVDLASRAAEDELDHARLCRQIINSITTGLHPLKPDLGIIPGPVTLEDSDRTLYVAVAVGCVTESLSTALLLEMRKAVTVDMVRQVISRILKDEIDHSRLGWAYLAHRATKSDVSFIANYIGPMVEAARGGEMQRVQNLKLVEY